MCGVRDGVRVPSRVSEESKHSAWELLRSELVTPPCRCEHVETWSWSLSEDWAPCGKVKHLSEPLFFYSFQKGNLCSLYEVLVRPEKENSITSMPDIKMINISRVNINLRVKKREKKLITLSGPISCVFPSASTLCTGKTTDWLSCLLSSRHRSGWTALPMGTGWKQEKSSSHWHHVITGTSFIEGFFSVNVYFIRNRRVYIFFLKESCSL